jgi:Family of unknown function (DUF6519)
MGNFSRTTFDELKHYVSVRLQQGVPLVDADWNEKDDIRRHELQSFLKWFVGNGVPQNNDGFRIELLPSDAPDHETDFLIKGGNGTWEGAGRCLVEGLEIFNESDIRYTKQPLFNRPDLAKKWNVDPIPALTIPNSIPPLRRDIVYLDVWEREVNSDEDTSLKNEVIGVETCIRLKREWAVRVAEGNSIPLPKEKHAHYKLANLRRGLTPFGVFRKVFIAEDLRDKILTLAEMGKRVKFLENRLLSPFFVPQPKEFDPEIASPGQNITLFGRNFDIGNPNVILVAQEPFGEFGVQVIGVATSQMTVQIPQGLPPEPLSFIVKSDYGQAVSQSKFAVGQ